MPNPRVDRSIFKPHEIIFCNEYIKNGGSSVDALKAAGKVPHPSNASTMLRRPHIMRYIAEQQQKIQLELNKRTALTFEWKMETLRKVIECSIIEEDGVTKLINHKAVLGAIAELNKMQGHYSAEKILSAHVVVDADVEQVKQLLKIYSREY